MCNLYSITTNQAAIIALFRVVNRYVGKPIERTEPIILVRSEKDPLSLIRVRSLVLQTCDLLADLCVKAWKLPAYRRLSKKFPHGANNRFRCVSDIFAIESGPLFPFREPAERLLGHWRDSEQDRHMMALGLMRVA